MSKVTAEGIRDKLLPKLTELRTELESSLKDLSYLSKLEGDGNESRFGKALLNQAATSLRGWEKELCRI